MAVASSSRMTSSKKKKLSAANRRIRERSRLSFLFVIFFFGLFSLIIVMESLMTDGDKNLLKDEDIEEGEDYSNWDISYEESPPGVSSSSGSSSMVVSASSSVSHHGTATASKNINNNDNKYKSNVGTINIPYAGSLRYQGPPVSRQQALQHVDLHASTLAASLFGNPKIANNIKNTSSVGSSSSPRQSNINSHRNNTVNTHKKGTREAASHSAPVRNIHPIQPDWQEVVGSREKFYVYSAYYNTVFE